MKIKSLNIDQSISASPQASDDIVTPKPSPRKKSSKKNRAPSSPSTPTSSMSSGNMSPRYGSYNIRNLSSKTEKFHALNEETILQTTPAIRQIKLITIRIKRQNLMV